MSTTSTTNANERITAEVTSWPGVEARLRSPRGVVFSVAPTIRSPAAATASPTFGFPKAVWRELFAEDRITHHPVFPGKEGFAARAIESEDDVRDVIELLRLNYERVTR